MSERDIKREKIQDEMSRINTKKDDAIRRLRGREYVHQKQITARSRLFKDLDERLETLQKQYDALGEDEDDE